MEEWKEYKLGELIELKNGVPFKSSEFIDAGIPVIKIKNVKPNTILFDDLSYVAEESSLNKRCFWIRPSDILITMTGNRKDGGADSWVGKVALFKKEGKYLLNQRVSAIRVKDDDVIDYVYLAYLLSSWDSQLYFVNHSNSSGGQANISPSVVNDYEIVIPSFETQQKISKILSSLDDKIEVNRRINEQLEELAQALFKSWFVDFEPFKDGEFVESELGMIPKGWKIGTLGDVADVVMGASPAGSSYNTEGNGSIFYQGSTDFGFRFPCIRMYTTEPKRFAESNSVLLSVRAPVGDVNIAFEKCCIGRGLASIKSNCNADSYTYYLMKSLKLVLDNYNNEGTVFGCINKDALNNLLIVVPTIEIIKEFEKVVSSFDMEIRCRSEEITYLSNLRDTLLPKLMSGEIDVNEVVI